ncbi:hypothetical protein QAD02_023820 [Eretmocerus hayati]|uniref:Uncharacterized protein n=1 Tax=Eretmocerus hayati TaxID=131215 RepID=A0ACC2PXA4_9HYME|nr:hypothetical protein QAD02_023820 [Eretmocerus hayati]
MAPNVIDGISNFRITKNKSVSVADNSEEKSKECVLSKHSRESSKYDEIKNWYERPEDIKWLNSTLIISFHLFALYGIFTLPYFQRWKTFLWSFFVASCGAFGITAGAHRLWSHKSYKASNPMKFILMMCFCCAGQNSMYHWVRDHRLHHKHSETDADPHNSNRGFFFSHCGWLMQKKHPEVLMKGKQIDMSDIEADPVVMFFEKYFTLSKVVISYLIPIMVPVYFWNEDWYYSFLFQFCRYIFSLNATWSVNSFAHLYGYKPYDKSIAPVENKFVAIFSLGEGWHNYHHTFPYDYRAAEIGGSRFNPTTTLIDLFSKIGWAYDCRVPSENLIKMTVANRGCEDKISNM